MCETGNPEREDLRPSLGLARIAIFWGTRGRKVIGVGTWGLFMVAAMVIVTYDTWAEGRDRYRHWVNNP